MTQDENSLEPIHHAWLRHEKVIDRFEEAWQTNDPAAIEEFLPPQGTAERQHVLHELIKVDLEYRWGRAEQPGVEDYVSRFPELGDIAKLPTDLIVEELRLREFHGCAPTQAELERRFPERLPELSAQLNEIKGARTPKTTSGAIAGASLPATVRVADLADAEMGISGLPESCPRRLGRYVLLRAVGQGGFATVYRAHDPQLNREVAIKVPRAEFMEQPDARERVLREAGSAARLRHPAIVPIHEVGQDGDHTYIVYEFIPGPTLAQLLRQTKPAPEQAAAWVARIAEALDYAHACGIVHRDVKPANIMMDGHGEPAIADFGLALQADAAITLTRHGDLLGTPAYMSPEQARGEGHKADARTDVYGLGVLLYELLCGRTPFEGGGAGILHQVIHEEPLPPSRSGLGIPADLETICLKAMAKEPDRRYASAGAMADDLRRYLSHLPIRARRISPLGRFALWCRRNPALASTIAVAAAVILVVASVSFWRVIQERDRAEAHLYKALVDGARAQMQARDTGWWWKAMDNIDQAAKLNVAGRDPVELRELAIECMGSAYPCFRLRGEWSGHIGPVTSVAFSPDGEWVASGSRDQTARIWSRHSGEQVAVLSGHSGAVTCVAFHPDGTRLASSSADGSVRVWDLGALRRGRIAPPTESVGGAFTESVGGAILPRQVSDLQAGSLAAVAFSPDGQWLAAGAQDGTIHLLPITEQGTAASDRQTRLLTAHSDAVTCLEFSSDGKLLASGSLDLSVRIWDVAAGEVTKSWTTGEAPRTLAFLPGDVGVAWARHENYGFGWFMLKGEDKEEITLHTGPVLQVRCDKGGRVLTASGDGTLKLWPRLGFKELAVARGEYGATHSAAFAPDSRWVVAGYHDGRVRLWELAEPPHRTFSDGHSAVFVPGKLVLAKHYGMGDFSEGFPGRGRPYVGPRHSNLVWGVAASPDGRWVATASHDETVKLWNAETGELVRTLEGYGGLVWCVAFSPDSKYLVSGSGAVHVWDIATGRELHRLEGHSRLVVSLAFHPTRPWLASSSLDGSVRLWDTETWKPLGTLHQFDQSVHQLAFRPDGRWLAAACHDHRVALWDLSNEPAGLSRRDRADRRDKPGGSSAASTPPDRFLSGHAGSVWAVGFNPDGTYLASASEDGHIILWNGETLNRVVTLRGSTPRLRSLSFSHDDRFLAAGSLGGPMIIWDLGQVRQTLREMKLDW